MCNLYSNTTAVEAMRRLFDIDRSSIGNAEPLKAIFPRYQGHIVRQTEDAQRELSSAHWGFLIPQTSKKTGKPILPKAINNTRDDKIRSSRFWSKSFEDRRCLIPASAFCEAAGKRPATYYWFSIGSSGDPEPFAFAGIWSTFRGNYRDELVEIDTYSMVTSTPNSMVKPIHPDRMPVILAPEDYKTWMTGSAVDAFALLRAYPAEKMQILDSGTDLRSEPG